MNDQRVWDALFTPATMLPDPVDRLRSARRDDLGRVTVWPTCSLAGHTDPLALVVDPIDPLNPAHDSTVLARDERRRQHCATVLAEAAWLA